MAGLLADRLGFFGPAVQTVGPLKILGVLLVLVGGVLMVRY